MSYAPEDIAAVRTVVLQQTKHPPLSGSGQGHPIH